VNFKLITIIGFLGSIGHTAYPFISPNFSLPALTNSQEEESHVEELEEDMWTRNLTESLPTIQMFRGAGSNFRFTPSFESRRPPASSEDESSTPSSTSQNRRQTTFSGVEDLGSDDDDADGTFVPASITKAAKAARKASQKSAQNFEHLCDGLSGNADDVAASAKAAFESFAKNGIFGECDKSNNNYRDFMLLALELSEALYINTSVKWIGTLAKIAVVIGFDKRVLNSLTHLLASSSNLEKGPIV
jgi:hypothetical protein